MTTTRPSTPPLPRPGPAGRPADTPSSTYRLQLGPGFPFAAAEEALPYLVSLGLSHLHLSPVLEAVPGSAHGYDVTDHSRVRVELGGEAGLRALSAAAHREGLGIVVDVVPNHMAVPADLRLNRQLWQMLRDGPGSASARWFDVDWEAGDGRLLLPVLAGPLHEELPRLSRRRDTLRHDDGLVLPLRPGTEQLPVPELLDAQHYRPAWWRLARTDLNYRRFFTVSGLIGIRVEDPAVFDAVHGKVLQLMHEGVIDGLRVDHPDGLADPCGYVRRLHEATGGRWTVLEKILGRDEALPAHWPAAGTTGYDTLYRIDGLFTDPEGHAELAGLYQRYTRVAPRTGGDWAATALHAAAGTVGRELAAETARLARAAERACEAVPGLRRRDHSRTALRAALRLLLARLTVYRPYVRPGTPARREDVSLLDDAAERARACAAAPDEASAVDLVRDLALGRFGAGPEQREFAVRFGQVSSALRAKAVEDTAFYRYSPLISACEVGGAPGLPSVTPEEFHAHCARLQRDWPATGTVLSTHDTKRSGDVRAALAVLTECPGRWAALLAELEERDEDDGAGRAPDRHTAWTAWQTAFGLGIPDPERLAAAVLKSVREAGLRTTWTEPDPEFEAAVDRFVRSGPGRASGRRARAVAALARELAPHVRTNVLGTALLHLTMPGVPDVYQGTERLYAALVDPDNRRPVPFGAPPRRGLDSEKLRLTRTALRLRRTRPGLFLDGAGYEPLHADGPAAGHCVAFVRCGPDGAGQAVTAVTRLGMRLEEAGGWRETTLRLPPGRWHELLTGHTGDGGSRPLAVLFAESPVALLVRV